MAYLDMPQTLVERHRKYLARRVPQSAKKATHIVAVSEYSKRRLVEYYGISPDKISVVEPSIDHDKYQPASADEVTAIKRKYGIKGKYILFHGTMEPRKNVAGILRAYKLLSDKQRNEYQLVLSGGKGWLDTEINELAESIPKDRLIRTGYLPDGEEPALFTGAEVFLYPSLYEGWGMQLLEAMACGTPAITATNSSLPEAGGAAVEYVKSTEAEDIAETLSKLLDDPKRRQQMSAAGLKQAQNFSWRISAEKLAVVLRKAGSR